MLPALPAQITALITTRTRVGSDTVASSSMEKVLVHDETNGDASKYSSSNLPVNNGASKTSVF